jgi:lipid-binding SYLF domain-containing protein
MRTVGFGVIAALGLVSVPEASAQNWKDRLQQGADVVREGASAAQKGASGVANRVNESVNSTVDLLTNEATPQETRDELDTMAIDVMNRLFSEQPDAALLFEQSAGYAVFDTRKLVLAGLAAGAGRGVAVSRDGSNHVYMNMGTAGVGLSFGIGGFETQVVILFEDEFKFLEFVTSGYDATAEAGTMFGDDKESLGIRWIDGRAIFYLTRKGWKASATAAGTKYWVDSTLN